VRAGGKRYRVGRRAKRLRVRLPARPRKGLVRFPLRITARGPRQPVLAVTRFVVRG
jgi:hypothetical protein